MDQVETLCGLLGEEAAVCGALTAALREEQRAMIALEPEGIFAALGKRRALQEELGRLASHRRTLVRDVARARGADASSATELLVALPPEPRAELLGRLRTLRRSLLEARGLERQNTLLARASLQQTDELLRTLRGLVPGAHYGADAQIAAPAALESVDRRV
ncbi:MAG TPA: flagellar export chaperone FlgN [Candidatus Binatus sp.]|nr:flagellar export chaperone FlgN [Candidatus Binatus sp.]